VERGPDQGNDADFKANRQYEHCFTGSSFTKQLSNGNSVDRDWMMCCKTNKSLFCFPCIFLGKQTNALSDTKKKDILTGRTLHPRIADHRTRFLKSMSMEK
jgi:hypothetical protein